MSRSVKMIGNGVVGWLASTVPAVLFGAAVGAQGAVSGFIGAVFALAGIGLCIHYGWPWRYNR